jgi:hypothetical protein
MITELKQHQELVDVDDPNDLKIAPRMSTSQSQSLRQSAEGGYPGKPWLMAMMRMTLRINRQRVIRWRKGMRMPKMTGKLGRWLGG